MTALPPLPVQPVPARLLQGLGQGAPVRAALDRSTTAERVADSVRERILLGVLRSGTQCPEQDWAAELGVSRNTLREAFQILVGERLLAREPYRGVFVRRLDVADVRDIYTFRRLVECSALAGPTQPDGLAAMRAAVADGQAAAGRGEWFEVGTADVRFHMAVASVAGSSRVDRAMRALFAELRLAFQLVRDPHELHAPYLARNAEILDLVERGLGEPAGALLRTYLDDAESQIVAAVEDG